MRPHERNEKTVGSARISVALVCLLALAAGDVRGQSPVPPVAWVVASVPAPAVAPVSPSPLLAAPISAGAPAAAAPPGAPPPTTPATTTPAAQAPAVQPNRAGYDKVIYAQRLPGIQEIVATLPQGAVIERIEVSYGQIAVFYRYATGSVGSVAYRGIGGAVTIPGTINGLPVTSTAEAAFAALTSRSSVTIPNRVTSIGADESSPCSSLTSATISNDVTSIGADGFSTCSSLTSVTIPNGLTLGYVDADVNYATGPWFGDGVWLDGDGWTGRGLVGPWIASKGVKAWSDGDDWHGRGGGDVHGRSDIHPHGEPAPPAGTTHGGGSESHAPAGSDHHKP